jgi:hypothetical protein
MTDLNKLIPAIDVFTIIGETLEAVLHASDEKKAFVFINTKQHWYNTIINSDRIDIGNNETIRPIMWRRIYNAFIKSEALQIPVYADEWFETRIGCMSVDAFVNACIECAQVNPILWERLVIGAADRIDYLNFFSYVLNN